jgi:hypothetical protein
MARRSKDGCNLAGEVSMLKKPLWFIRSKSADDTHPPIWRESRLLEDTSLLVEKTSRLKKVCVTRCA